MASAPEIKAVTAVHRESCQAAKPSSKESKDKSTRGAASHLLLLIQYISNKKRLMSASASIMWSSILNIRSNSPMAISVPWAAIEIGIKNKRQKIDRIVAWLFNFMG